MIVRCEKCQTKFKIPDEKVTEKGVKVRCTKCQTIFRVKKSDAGPPPLPAVEAESPFSPPTRRAASMGVSSQARRVGAGPSPSTEQLPPPLPRQSDFSPENESRELSQQPGLDPLQFLNQLSSDPPPEAAPGAEKKEEVNDPFTLLMPGAPTPGPAAFESEAPVLDAPLTGAIDANGSSGSEDFSARLPADGRPTTSRLGAGFRPIARPARVHTAERAVSSTTSAFLKWTINLALGSMLAGLLFAFGVALASEGKLDFSSFFAPAGVDRSGLVLEDIASGQYETRAGRPIFFVRGVIRNQGANSTRAKIRVEIVDGNQIVQSTETIAGASAGPEELFGLSTREDVVQMIDRLSKERDQLAPQGRLPFTAVFYDFPPDLSGMRLKLTAQPLGPSETARR